MINFEIKISVSQVKVLQVIKQQQDHLEAHGLTTREYLKLPPKELERHRAMGENLTRVWLTGGSFLKREGLVTHDPVNYWQITEKGRLVLRIVEMEVSEFQQQTQPKRIKAVKGKAA